MSDHTNDVIKREQGVALDLRVHILALCAHGQELHQMDVVHERTVFIHPVTLGPHHLDQSLERGSVIVEHEDVLSRVDKLGREKGFTVATSLQEGGSLTQFYMQQEGALLPTQAGSFSLNSSRSHLLLD